MRFILIAALALATADARCLVDTCFTDEDCASCGTLTENSHYIYAAANYTCHAPLVKPAVPGVCKIGLAYAGTPAYKEMVNTCKNSPTAKCCTPDLHLSSKLAQCSRRSCRQAIDCTIDGVCVYDTSEDAAGSLVKCCNSDSDCPPYHAPYFWNTDAAPLRERMCTTVHCDALHNCIHSIDEKCCVSDKPDCNTYQTDSVCSTGACVYDPALATALGMNPQAVGFTQSARESIEAQAAQPQSTPDFLAEYRTEYSPMRCESRVFSACQCQTDADCAFVSASQCAIAKCMSTEESGARRHCVSVPRARPADKDGVCCTGNLQSPETPLTDEELKEQCTYPGDPCMIPVSCSSTTTTSHDMMEEARGTLAPRGSDGLLPLFECRYVRRNETASCCSSDSECLRLSKKNSCVAPACGDNGKCALGEGYDFMGGQYKLPCCHTDADCESGDEGALTKALSDATGSCVTLKCSGDSSLVDISLRHRCVVVHHDVCPPIASATTTAVATTTSLINSVQSAVEEADVTGSFVLPKCAMPISVRLNFYEALTRFVSYPVSVSLNIGFDGAGTVPPADFGNAFKIVSAVDRSAAAFPLAKRRLFKDRNDNSGRAVFTASFDTSNSGSKQVNALNITFTLFLVTAKIGEMPEEAQGIFSRIEDSNITVRWIDGSETVKSVGRISFAARIAELGCEFAPAYVSGLARRNEDRGGNDPSWIEVPLSGTPTFAPTLAPTKMPTAAPTFAPTFPPTHVPSGSCNSTTNAIHCDALAGTCGVPITGKCANTFTMPGVCIPTAGGGSGPFPLLTIPEESRRIVTILNPAIVSTTSFCYASAGQCLSLSSLGPHTPGSCTCDCACKLETIDGVEYFSECRSGAMYTTQAPTTAAPITYFPTRFPTPFPTSLPATDSPTPSPLPESASQCGSPQAPCSFLSSCETRTSLCVLGFCEGGCGLGGTYNCTLNSHCTSHTCCGCDAGSGLGYFDCIVAPLAGTPSPTPNPTAPPTPTFSPSPVPTKLPTKMPTAVPTAPPTPVPTPLNNGETNTELRRCADKPWIGPWIGDAVIPSLSNYSDFVPNTKVTVEAVAGACEGCARQFVSGSQCIGKCILGQGTHFSVPFNVTLENWDKVHTLPRGDDGTQREGVIMLVNVTLLKVNNDPKSTCVTISPVLNSIEISPPEVDAGFPAPNRRPGFSAHRAIDSTHAFIVFRTPILPRMPVDSLVPTRIEFQVRIEGCASLFNATAKQLFRIEARLVTGACDELVDRWIHCFKNPYPAPNTTNQYVYDYRQCVDGHVDEYSVAQTGNSPYGPNCAQNCPPTPAPTLPITMSGRLLENRDSLIEPQLAVFNASSYAERGVVVAIVEDEKARLESSEANVCARNVADPSRGLVASLANRFLCSVDNKYPKGKTFEAERAVHHCYDSDHRVNVMRYPVDIHNVNPTSGDETISGRMKLKVQRKSYDPAYKQVCSDFYALYKFVTTSSATVDVISVSAGDDHNEIVFEYRGIASNEFLRVYIYLLICDNTDYDLLPIEIRISASVEDIDYESSNGVEPASVRGRDSYTFNITDVSIDDYDEFDCNELQLSETHSCSGAELAGTSDNRCAGQTDLPCAHRCSIEHGARAGASIFVAVGLCLCVCAMVGIGCACFHNKRAKKSRRNARESDPEPDSPVRTSQPPATNLGRAVEAAVNGTTVSRAQYSFFDE